tara:strand:- start:271 stop:456 length:186 start_codon:yes stop_codon:yes gene_type:complete
MSQIPKLENSNKNPWQWVDSQLEKLMKANIKLRKENKKLKKYVTTLESQVDELNHTLAGRR